MTKCVGLMGRIFGHKFIKSRAGYTYTSSYCFRCGYSVGKVDFS